jgi:hypothetical protein
MDDIIWDHATALVVVCSRLATGRNSLNDMSELGNVFKDIGDAKGPDDLDLRQCEQVSGVILAALDSQTLTS